MSAQALGQGAPAAVGEQPHPRVVDLSVGVDPRDWEPDRMRRHVVSHREGADRLGRAYTHFTARNRADRWWKNLRHRLGGGVDHRDFPGGEGLSLMRYEMTTHTGTHVDAPFHYGTGVDGRPGRTIDEVPLQWCHGDGVLLDVRHGPADEAVSEQEVRDALAAIGHEVAPGEIVLFWTGGDTEIGRPGYFQNFRGISGEATAYLVERGVRMLGVDSFGFDAPFLRMLEAYRRTGDRAFLWPAHVYGRRREYCHIERLTNLAAIGRPLGFQVSCFPIKLVGADAGWSRVVATMPS